MAPPRRRRVAWGARCAVCGRALLPGEPVHHFQDPDRDGHDRDGHDRVVCPLCHRRAVARGWLRADAANVPGRSAPAA